VQIASSATVICPGEQVALAASGASTYVWSTGSTQGVILVNPASTTAYSVVGTGTNGCTSTASFTQSVNLCVGLGENVSVTGISVYPNPSQAEVIVETGVDVKLILSDASGRMIGTYILDESNKRMLQIPELSPGIYFISDINGIIPPAKVVIIR
jgi:peroxiredoxin